MHLPRCQTRYLSVASPFLELGRSRRERSLERTVGAAPTVPRSHWESLALLLLYAHWHCHDWGKKKCHGVSYLGGAGIKLWRPSGESDARTSLQWLSVYPQEEWWRHGPIFRRNRKLFWYVRRVTFGVFGEWTHLWLHLGFRIISIDPSYVTCQHFPGQFRTASVELLQHELAPLNPNLSLCVCQRMGDPPCTSFSDTKMIVQYGHGRCSNAKTFLNVSSGNNWFDPN